MVKNPFLCGSSSQKSSCKSAPVRLNPFSASVFVKKFFNYSKVTLTLPWLAALKLATRVLNYLLSNRPTYCTAENFQSNVLVVARPPPSEFLRLEVKVIL